MPQTILVVDDEPELVRVLRGYLEKSGYRAITAPDGPTALAQYKHEHPDLVLLDLNMPGMDGLDVARALRKHGDVPIIMVTARVEETDRLIGLELGADDYIAKPFSPREVVARVRAVLRRSTASPPLPQILRAQDIELDRDRHSVTRAGQPVDLTPTEFALLAALLEQPGRPLTRLQSLEAASGDAYEGYERTVDAHIKNLRAKLEPDPRKPRYVLTVFGVGYKFSDE